VEPDEKLDALTARVNVLERENKDLRELVRSVLYGLVGIQDTKTARSHLVGLYAEMKR
jgi:hypothetical protein